MSTRNIEIDEIDKIIITLLQTDASLGNNEIAKRVSLSPSATHERIKKLYMHGVIKKIVAFIQAAVVERSLCAFIHVLIDTPANSKIFLEEMAKHDAVMECHHITGEYSYLLKVRVKNTQHLEVFITDSLKTHLGVTKTVTSIVLSSPKDGDTIID